MPAPESAQLNELQAFMVLNMLPRIGPVKVRNLLRACGSPNAVLAASRKDLQRVPGIGSLNAGIIRSWRDHADLHAEEARCREHGVRFIPQTAQDYPAFLRTIHDPPTGLYAKGRYAPPERAVAIVGSRRATLYGQQTARRLARELTRFGYTIVSGLARGIDSAAHEGALEAGGRTLGVLGCGIDITYPPESAELFHQVQASAGILSEFRFGTQPDRQTFPMRNRLISGLSQGVIVVETDVRGGSMITAGFAGDQGREVFAIPGRIDQASSRGCHRLIRDGATLVTCVDDILAELNSASQLEMPLASPPHQDAPGPHPHRPPELPAGLGADERRLMACLSGGGIYHPDTLASEAGLPIQAVSSALLILELKQLVARRADGSYESRH